MGVVPTEKIVLATLASDVDDPATSGVPLSRLTQTVGGDGERLSRQVELTVAVETLVGEDHLERETGENGEQILLTGEGRDRASAILDQLLETEIEVVETDARQSLRLADAARELDRSPVALAADCSAEGVYYRRDTVTSDGLIGRDSEREQFQTILDRVERDGAGEIVIFSGSGGVGKTTLTETLLDQAGPAVETLRTRCREAGDEPYQPIRDAVAQTDASDPFAAADFEIADAETYEAQQTALFHDVTEILAPSSGVRVLFLDDIDLADAATWTYLSYLCERVCDLPVVLLGTHRPGTLPEDTPISPGESEVPVSRITLTGLDRADTERLVEQILNRRGVPDAFVEAVHERTDGNPLFVETTVETLLDRNELDPQLQWYPESVADIDLPDAVRETIVQRLEILDGSAREVLEWVAVAGESAPVEILEELCDLPGERVGTIVEMLTDAEMFIEDERDGARRVTLRSNVVREALLADIDSAELERRHEAIADSFEDTVSLPSAADQSTVEQAGRIAYHHERAANGEAAIEWYREAAERATDVYAHETATEQYHRILDIARSMGETEAMLSASHQLVDIYLTISEYEQANRYVRFVREQAGEDEADHRRKSALLAARIAIQRGEFVEAIEEATAGLELSDGTDIAHCRLLAVKAEAEWRKSEYDAAEETCEQFRTLAGELDATDLEAEASEQMAMIFQERSEYDWAREYYQQALEQAEAVGDRHHGADIRNGLGIVAHRSGNTDEAREYYEQALETFEAVGDRHQAAKLYNNLAIIANTQGDTEQAREYYQRVLETGEAVGDRNMTAAVRLNLGSIFHRNGVYDESRAYAEQALETFQAAGDDHRASLAMLNIAEDDIITGDYGTARKHLERALEINRAVGDDYRIGLVLDMLGEVAIEEGAYDRAATYFEDAVAALETVGNQSEIGLTRTDQAMLSWYRGDHEAAHEHAESALTILREHGEDPAIANALRVRGLAETGLGDYEQARETLLEANRLYEDVENPHALAQVERAVGALACEQGEYDRATDSLEAALETFERLGATPDTARTRRALGRVAAATGDRETARMHWERALETFEAIGASADAVETLEALVTHPGESKAAREWCEKGLSLTADLDTGLAAEQHAWFSDQLVNLE